MFNKENRRETIIVFTSILFAILIIINTILGFTDVYDLKYCNLFNCFVLSGVTALNFFRFRGKSKRKSITMLVLSVLLMILCIAGLVMWVK